MSGSLINLTAHPVRLPDPLIVDTNVVVAGLLAPRLQPDPVNALRATAFLDDLLASHRRAILPPTAYSELLHLSIRLRYQEELRANRQAITAQFGTRISSWTELYKRDRSILRGHLTDLTQLRHELIANNIVIAAPDDLGPIPSGRSYDEELIHLIGRYELDTNDTLILMEASRLGVPAIVTMDADLHRAAIDFDIYTWL